MSLLLVLPLGNVDVLGGITYFSEVLRFSSSFLPLVFGFKFSSSFFFFGFLRLQLQHMEVPRLGVESELQLLAYATATATATGSKPSLRPAPQLTATPNP